MALISGFVGRGALDLTGTAATEHSSVKNLAG